MINIEELEAENRRLRDELLRVKRELMETAAVEQAFKDRDIKDLALRLFAVRNMDAESVEKAYRQVISANNVIKESLGF